MNLFEMSTFNNINDLSSTLSVSSGREMLKDLVEANANYRTWLMTWLFICRRQLYRDRFLCGVKRDENFKVVRNKNGHIEFLEDPKTATKFEGLNDDRFYYDYVAPKFNPLYGSFFHMLGDGNLQKGKDIVRQKLVSGEYALTTEAVEYAQAKMFAELESDIKFLRNNALQYNRSPATLYFPLTTPYFEKGMKEKLDLDYVDELAESQLGITRIDAWNDEDEFNIDRAKIQIDCYCKEFLAKKSKDTFMFFDNAEEKLILPEDFKKLHTRYMPFVQGFKELYTKYEIAMWGSGGNPKSGGFN